MGGERRLQRKKCIPGQGTACSRAGYSGEREQQHSRAGYSREMEQYVKRGGVLRRPRLWKTCKVRGGGADCEEMAELFHKEESK